MRYEVWVIWSDTENELVAQLKSFNDAMMILSNNSIPGYIKCDGFVIYNKVR